MPKLSAVQQNFILHWGEMGTRWGINRTVAQIHALLFISPRPLPAEDIADTLAVARSNVSTSLRELQGWGIVKLVHVLGDKRDHFESMKDVWEMFRVVLDERKKREIDPTMRMLRDCIAEADKDKTTDPYTGKRLRELA
jgi:DNA-binding transcriptional regulator GbsR (MarR family)